MSNKEEKKQIKEEKQQAAVRRGQRNALLFKVALVIFIPIVLFVFYQGLFNRAPVLAPDEIALTDHVKGADDAPLTITVYADFQCPQCLTEAEVIARAWPQISSKVQLVYRFYPLDTHRHSFLAARYAEAAGIQGSFWEMHDILFGNQGLWSALPEARSIFDGYAEQLGLDMEQLSSDLDSVVVRNKIIADQQGGTRAGVRGTPVMFINGRRVTNPRTAGELISMVDEAISG